MAWEGVAMLVTAVRLGFAGLWAVLGVILLGRAALFPPDVFANYDPVYLDLGGLLALVLAAYNVTRWLLGRRRASRRVAPSNPLAGRPRAERVEEYNPELDFGKE